MAICTHCSRCILISHLVILTIQFHTPYEIRVERIVLDNRIDCCKENMAQIVVETWTGALVFLYMVNLTNYCKNMPKVARVKNTLNTRSKDFLHANNSCSERFVY